MALTEEQKTLLQGLKEYGVESEAIIGIMVGLKEPEKTEKMIDFLLDNPKATQSDILSETAKICRETERASLEKEEIYYQMEAASGRTVRVPSSKLKEWMEGQAAIERGEAPLMSEESTAALSEMLGISEEK